MFVAEYCMNGNNATQAYLKMSPDVQENTAGTEGHKLLKQPEIMGMLAKVNAKYDVSSVSTRDYLIQEAHEIGLKSKEIQEFGTALRAVDTKAKLSGAYQSEVGEVDAYKAVMSKLVVNNTVNIVQDGTKPVKYADIEATLCKTSPTDGTDHTESIQGADGVGDGLEDERKPDSKAVDHEE